MCFGVACVQDNISNSYHSSIAGVASWQLSISPGEIVINMWRATKDLELAPTGLGDLIGESSNC